jgi:heptaprenyl diphosphate synthase
MSRVNRELEQYVFAGILCAQGIILGLIEQSLPSPFPLAPGAKLGLTNIITLIALVLLPFKDCILLTFLRLVITALISGGVSTFIYAAAGATLSLILMKIFLLFTPKIISLIGVSIIGGVSHNFGQLIVATILAQSKYIMLYLPILTIIGILAGLVVGLVSNYLFHYVQALSFVKENLSIKER